MVLSVVQREQIKFLIEYVVVLIIKADFSSAEDFFKDQLYRHFHDICNFVEDGELSMLSQVSDQDKVACWSVLVLSIARGFQVKQGVKLELEPPIAKINELFSNKEDRDFFRTQSLWLQSRISKREVYRFKLM